MKLELSQGRFALVDDEDFEYLSQWKWTLMRHPTPVDGAYAYRKVDRRSVMLHRVIMGAPKGLVVDHRNKHGLDNRRKNLRLCTYRQNNANAKAHRIGRKSSQYKGVHWCSTIDRWIAKINKDGTTKTVYRGQNEIEAAMAYDLAAVAEHGEFAEINGV